MKNEPCHDEEEPCRPVLRKLRDMRLAASEREGGIIQV